MKRFAPCNKTFKVLNRLAYRSKAVFLYLLAIIQKIMRRITPTIERVTSIKIDKVNTSFVMSPPPFKKREQTASFTIRLCKRYYNIKLCLVIENIKDIELSATPTKNTRGAVSYANNSPPLCSLWLMFL